MKQMMVVFGILFFLTGLSWLLQGLGILSGTLMSGQFQWVINGGIVMVIGGGMWLIARTR